MLEKMDCGISQTMKHYIFTTLHITSPVKLNISNRLPYTGKYQNWKMSIWDARIPLTRIFQSWKKSLFIRKIRKLILDMKLILGFKKPKNIRLPVVENTYIFTGKIIIKTSKFSNDAAVRETYERISLIGWNRNAIGTSSLECVPEWLARIVSRFSTDASMAARWSGRWRGDFNDCSWGIVLRRFNFYSKEPPFIYCFFFSLVHLTPFYVVIESLRDWWNLGREKKNVLTTALWGWWNIFGQ